MLRAALASDTRLAGVALRSPLWQHDLLDRPPDRHEIAVPKVSELSPGLLNSFVLGIG